jgi:hypothetical protein
MASKIYGSTSPPPSTEGAAQRPAPGAGAAYGPSSPSSAPTPPPAPAATPPTGSDADDKPNPAVAAFHRIKGDINELKEYANFYVAAKIDGIKQTIRKIGMYAALGVVGLIAFGALMATAVGLLVVGLAQGLGRLFGDRYWLGDIVAGVLVLAAIALGVWLMMKKLTGTWRSQTIKKYEERKQSQRERFGHDVSVRAAQAQGGGGAGTAGGGGQGPAAKRG